MLATIATNSFCPFASPGTDTKFDSDVKKAWLLPNGLNVI